MKTTRVKLGTFCGIAAVGLIAAGCGSGDDVSDSHSATAPATVPSSVTATSAPAEVTFKMVDNNADVQALTARVTSLETEVANLTTTVQAVQKANTALNAWVPILQKVQTLVLGAPPYGGGGDLDQAMDCLGEIRAFLHTSDAGSSFGTLPLGRSEVTGMCGYFH